MLGFQRDAVWHGHAQMSLDADFVMRGRQVESASYPLTSCFISGVAGRRGRYHGRASHEKCLNGTVHGRPSFLALLPFRERGELSCKPHTPYPIDRQMHDGGGHHFTCAQERASIEN